MLWKINLNKMLDITKLRNMRVSQDNIDKMKKEFLKQLNFLDDKKLWNYLGDVGIYFASPKIMRQCFEVLEHIGGIMIYRLKTLKEIKKIDLGDLGEEYSIFFKEIRFHDPLEKLISAEETRDDEVNIIKTHCGKKVVPQPDNNTMTRDFYEKLIRDGLNEFDKLLILKGYLNREEIRM